MGSRIPPTVTAGPRPRALPPARGLGRKALCQGVGRASPPPSPPPRPRRPTPSGAPRRRPPSAPPPRAPGASPPGGPAGAWPPTPAALGRLQRAARSVERSSLWIDQVKRGDMLRAVRGPGPLVPEQIRLITAETAGRVEKIALRP